eukprot:6115875-Lingulodinium_polyedra.AAC.1
MGAWPLDAGQMPLSMGHQPVVLGSMPLALPTSNERPLWVGMRMGQRPLIEPSERESAGPSPGRKTAGA